MALILSSILLADSSIALRHSGVGERLRLRSSLRRAGERERGERLRTEDPDEEGDTESSARFRTGGEGERPLRVLLRPLLPAWRRFGEAAA